MAIYLTKKLADWPIGRQCMLKIQLDNVKWISGRGLGGHQPYRAMVQLINAHVNPEWIFTSTNLNFMSIKHEAGIATHTTRHCYLYKWMNILSHSRECMHVSNSNVPTSAEAYLYMNSTLFQSIGRLHMTKHQSIQNFTIYEQLTIFHMNYNKGINPIGHN